MIIVVPRNNCLGTLGAAGDGTSLRPCSYIRPSSATLPRPASSLCPTPAEPPKRVCDKTSLLSHLGCSASLPSSVLTEVVGLPDRLFLSTCMGSSSSLKVAKKALAFAWVLTVLGVITGVTTWPLLPCSLLRTWLRSFSVHASRARSSRWLYCAFTVFACTTGETDALLQDRARK